MKKWLCLALAMLMVLSLAACGAKAPAAVEEAPAQEAVTAEEPAAREPLYRVTDLEGKNLPYQVETADGVLSLTASADGAILTGTLRALGYLQNQGIEKITFTDGTHTATIVFGCITPDVTTDTNKTA